MEIVEGFPSRKEIPFILDQFGFHQRELLEDYMDEERWEARKERRKELGVDIYCPYAHPRECDFDRRAVFKPKPVVRLELKSQLQPQHSIQAESQLQPSEISTSTSMASVRKARKISTTTQESQLQPQHSIQAESQLQPSEISTPTQWKNRVNLNGKCKKSKENLNYNPRISTTTPT